MSKTAEVTMDKIESDILKATEEFAKVHSLHYDKHTASMVLNGMRAYHASKLSELNKMRELNESLSETILQQNEEIVELNNRLAEKK